MPGFLVTAILVDCREHVLTLVGDDGGDASSQREVVVVLEIFFIVVRDCVANYLDLF